ncbi:unnamed protein product [Toxocara canis]|nr:unnamed protein product [Toxocara canis]
MGAQFQLSFLSCVFIAVILFGSTYSYNLSGYQAIRKNLLLGLNHHRAHERFNDEVTNSDAARSDIDEKKRDEWEWLTNLANDCTTSRFACILREQFQ